MAYCMRIPEGAFHITTAPDHCAWPNLTLLPNGEIGATIFNQPSHGRMEGDIEFWVSADSGETWALRSQITCHKPNEVRMNVGAGLNSQGQMIVLCSAWDLTTYTRTQQADDVLEAQSFISTDNGHTWELTQTLAPPPGKVGFTPFGDVCTAQGACYAAGYTREYEGGYMVTTASHVYRSNDDGRTWDYLSTIEDGDCNETDLLLCDTGPWLAAVRTGDAYRPGMILPRRQPYVRLYMSDDCGASWSYRCDLSYPGHHPPHLLRLADGRILLTHGARNVSLCGVMGRICDTNGESWSAPFVLVGDLLSRDCGYPSSVQLATGEIVTAYYSQCSPWYQRYHMGVLRWHPDMIDLQMNAAWT